MGNSLGYGDKKIYVLTFIHDNLQERELAKWKVIPNEVTNDNVEDEFVENNAWQGYILRQYDYF